MKIIDPSLFENLSQRRAPEDSWILSVYVNLDPALRGDRRGGYKLVVERLLKDLENQIDDEAKREHFREDAEWVRRQVNLHIPGGKSFALFCDVSDGFTFVEDLPVRVASGAWYGKTPYVRPLLEAWREYERYGVVLVDREKARFLVLSVGQVEEVDEAFQTPAVKHRRTTGTDHMRSQMVFQRRAATWSNWFLKEVGDKVHDMVAVHDIDRILLAGPEEITAELERLLPKAVASRVVGRLRLPISAKPDEVLEAALPVIQELEEQESLLLVEDLVTVARKTENAPKAVTGLNASLNAVNQGRVFQLVILPEHRVPGFHCPGCSVLLDHAPPEGACPYCSKPLEPTDDIIWLASERVLSMGGKVEEAHGDEARAALQSAGGIGAYLR